MDPEVSLYDALEDIYIDEPNYFPEKIINCESNNKSALQTPGTSPPRDYETGDPFCDTVNLDEFFASVFNRDEEDGGAVLKGQGRSAAVGTAVISSIKGQAEKVNILGSGSTVKSSAVVRQNEIFQSTRTLSFGEEIDEYIRVHLMPYCSHEEHHQDPPAKSHQVQTAIAPEDVPGLDTISFHGGSLPEDCPDFSKDADATEEAQTAAEVKKEMQLKFMTPIVVLTRVRSIASPIPESNPPKSVVPISPCCFDLTKRTSVSTGGKVTRGRKRGRATAIIKRTLKMTSSASSTPLTTTTGSRKRGRPPKVNIKMEASPGARQEIITIDDDDQPEKKPLIAAIVTTSSRPRRASIGAVYYGDPDSDEFTDDGPKSAKIKRPMSASRKQYKKPEITDAT